MRASRLPDDFSSMVALLRNPGAAAQLIICADARFDTHPFLALPVPILVPSLITRMSEVPRIIDEFAADAIKELGAREECFTKDDRQWVLKHCPLTLAEIEKATLRIVAIRMSTTRGAGTWSSATLLGAAIGALAMSTSGKPGHRRARPTRLAAMHLKCCSKADAPAKLQ